MPQGHGEGIAVPLPLWEGLCMPRPTPTQSAHSPEIPAQLTLQGSGLTIPSRDLSSELAMIHSTAPKSPQLKESRVVHDALYHVFVKCASETKLLLLIFNTVTARDTSSRESLMLDPIGPLRARDQLLQIVFRCTLLIN